MRQMEKETQEPRILIIDDHAVVRGGIQHLLRSKFPNATFVDCEDGDCALAAIASRTFDLAFLDVSMPGKDGIEILLEIKKIVPNLPIIVLSIYREDAYAVRAYRFGAAAYLQKGVTNEILVHATEMVLTGQRYINPELADKISGGLQMPKGIDLLSPKEYSVFLSLAQGIPLKEIAALQNVSPKTVTTHRTRILSKLNLSSNADIARFALKHGLID